MNKFSLQPQFKKPGAATVQQGDHFGFGKGKHFPPFNVKKGAHFKPKKSGKFKPKKVEYQGHK